MRKMHALFPLLALAFLGTGCIVDVDDGLDDGHHYYEPVTATAEITWQFGPGYSCSRADVDTVMVVLDDLHRTIDEFQVDCWSDAGLTIEGLPPGQYRLDVLGLPGDWYFSGYVDVYGGWNTYHVELR